jgi:hypothetical protein
VGWLGHRSDAFPAVLELKVRSIPVPMTEPHHGDEELGAVLSADPGVATKGTGQKSEGGCSTKRLADST